MRAAAAERNDLAHQIHARRKRLVDGARVAGGKIAQMDALDVPGRRTQLGGQVLPQRLGQKRHERGDQLGRREQAFVQRPIGVELVGLRRLSPLQKRSRLRRTYQFTGRRQSP